MTNKNIPYVLKKGGMYYAHNSAGYVSRVLMAELYDKEYAERHASHAGEVKAIPITDLITGIEEVQEYIDRMEAIKAAFKSHQCSEDRTTKTVDPLMQGVWFKSSVSGLLYRNHEAAGEIEGVKIDGQWFGK